MTVSNREITTTEKLVRKDPRLSLDVLPIPQRVTNKKQKAPAYLRPHKVKGRIYYSWRREGQKEIYLGDADYILSAVDKFKNKALT